MSPVAKYRIVNARSSSVGIGVLNFLVCLVINGRTSSINSRDETNKQLLKNKINVKHFLLINYRNIISIILQVCLKITCFKSYTVHSEVFTLAAVVL